ncbi:MAG: xanthine dehydrogenase YagR molybdenum-binding subunit, partial [Solirubrobacteraceae bacterium]|nr:xanthine dehydrogenase YagR molybdenum-binding subunit [Solirubrobacteraceae bacterium]
MSAPTISPAVGAPLARVEARAKVTGEARYAYEHHAERLAYCVPVQATIAKGRITSVDASEALALPGVLAVLSAENAPRLEKPDDAELAILQEPFVSYRGQIVAAVVADSLEAARGAERVVKIAYEAEAHDVALRADHPGLYKPDKVNPSFPTDTEQGDPDGALAAAPVSVDATYSTPAFHNNPMEPHATLAVWEDGGLTLYDSTQGASAAQRTLAQVFGLRPAQVRVISPHVGGGFGSKGLARPSCVLAALAAKAVQRPVKLALTRQQMFAFVGYRTPTIQRLRLGAGEDGRLTAIVHEVVEQTSTLKEFAEQTAIATRVMYAAPHRRTSHRLAALDVPTPSWLRAPGECPGMYALESALDELAHAAGIDPIELRVRNDTDVEPESGRPFSSRNLVACLREGAERFGWAERDPVPASTRDGRWQAGMGVAASTYPAYMAPGTASARRRHDGDYVISIAAADIGTGARTVLTQIAADALGVEPAHVTIKLGDSGLPRAGLAGGSMGTASWGTAVTLACRGLREAVQATGGEPGQELEVTADSADYVKGRADVARHAFGAQFADVRVDPDTGEVRVERMLGVFAAGRIINPRTARSQFIGGMTMGISMALHEEGIIDREFGDYLNHDFAQYHVAS